MATVFRSLAAAAAVVLAASVHAQIVAVDPDWKEAAPPPPPAVQTQRLVPITVTGSTLHWGVDPRSISIGPDGTVRYVVVAMSEGAINAMYEGVRCNTAEVKQYMRSSGGDWQPVQGADWKPLQGNGAARHSLLIARNGACVGNGANHSPQQIAADLVADPDRRFRPERR
jgi:hypothetical protein